MHNFTMILQQNFWKGFLKGEALGKIAPACPPLSATRQLVLATWNADFREKYIVAVLVGS